MCISASNFSLATQSGIAGGTSCTSEAIMKHPTAGRIIGEIGLALLAASWAGICFGEIFWRSALVPWLWTAAIVGVASATVGGIIASILHSKWWYCFVAVACLSLAVLLGAVGG